YKPLRRCALAGMVLLGLGFSQAMYAAPDSFLSETRRSQNEISVKGKVVSEDSPAGLPGVSIVIKGTTSGTVTDMDGTYELLVPDNNAVLVFSFVGYNQQEITVGNQTRIDITLLSDV